MAKIRNSLTDLNEYLFEALDVISNSDLFLIKQKNGS